MVCERTHRQFIRQSDMMSESSSAPFSGATIDLSRFLASGNIRAVDGFRILVWIQVLLMRKCGESLKFVTSEGIGVKGVFCLFGRSALI